MEKIQMTQIGIDNYMLYTKNDEKELCKICQTYPDSDFVDIIRIANDERVYKVDYSNSLKPIEVSKDIIEAFGFSIKKRQIEPKIYGDPANEVFDLVYKDKASWMVVLIYDLYYLLLNDTNIYFKTDYPLCVHHLQNLIKSIGGDSIKDEMSLVSMMKDNMLKNSRR